MLYPEFDRNLREGYREEIRLFLNSILRANRSVLDLLSSDETFVNERVARALRHSQHPRRPVPPGAA